MTGPEVVLLPGGAAGTAKIVRDSTVLDWIRVAHAGSRWTTAVCTGAFLLGEAGLLSGTEATTHWASTSNLAKYNAVYKPARFVQSEKIITAAGISAGIHMALYLASQIGGDDVAKAIQLAIEYSPQPPFNSGSIDQASQKTLQQAKESLKGWFAKEFRRFYPNRKSPE